MLKIVDFEWRSTLCGIYSDQLPHWVAECGRYAVTIRCRGSLPKSVLDQLNEIHAFLSETPAQSKEFLKMQRRTFKIIEHFLDQGTGFAPFRDEAHRRSLHNQIADYDHDGLRFSDWVIMPNHIHLITCPFRTPEVKHFKQAWVHFKMRTTRLCNNAMDRRGSLWQRSWFDRWIRSEEELRRWQNYYSDNPVSAGLCEKPEDWVGLQITR